MRGRFDSSFQCRRVPTNGTDSDHRRWRGNRFSFLFQNGCGRYHCRGKETCGAWRKEEANPVTPLGGSSIKVGEAGKSSRGAGGASLAVGTEGSCAGGREARHRISSSLKKGEKEVRAKALRLAKKRENRLGLALTLTTGTACLRKRQTRHTPTHKILWCRFDLAE